MEQDATAAIPVIDSGEKKDGKGWKIATVIASVVAVCGVGFGVYGMMQDKSEQEQDVPDGYIAVFHGGVGERTHETYIYKDDNDNPNYGFTYINTISTTKTYGSSEWRTVITERGSFDWADEAFSIAKKNGAYSYVTIPESDPTYTIENFKKNFKKNFK